MTTPATPPRAAAPPAITFATPQNPPGASSSMSYSGAFDRSLYVDTVGPSIRKDLDRKLKSDFDKLLTYFIKRISCNPETPPLLNQCLDAVLSIANDPAVRNKFAKYTILGGRESERYVPFVAACNNALIELRKKDFPGLRPPSTLAMLFHACGNEIPAKYKNVESKRKPDICCVSWHVAKKHYPRGKSEPPSPEAFMMEQALRTPIERYHWDEMLCSLDAKAPKRSATSAARVHQSSYTATSAPGEMPLRSFKSEDTFGPPPAGPSTRAVKAGNGASKRRKVMIESENFRTPSVRVASYGIEMLGCRPGVTHTIGIVVSNTDVEVWMFDRQGAIQSSVIDIVDDLPRFLTLLLAFDRFKLSDWGANPVLDPQYQTRHYGLAEAKVSPDVTTYVPTSGDTNDSHQTLTIKICDPPIFRAYNFVGRGTQVYPATTTIDDVEIEVVVKISWIEVVRISEVEILKRAMAVADDAVEGHIPQVLAFREFPEFATGNIRNALGIVTEAEKYPTTSRILRAIVFPRLRPITDLTGNDFLRAFFDCFQCHYTLWRNDIRHYDPSLNNLMIDSRGRGVMNDWDLAVIHGEGNLHGFDRTGTMPFMPLEFLTREFMDGKVERFYRHEAEGFVWILVVACRRFNNGKEVEDPTSVDKWFSGDYEAVCSAKSSYQNKLVLPKGQPSYWAQFYVARSLVWRLDEDLKKRTTQWRKSGSHVGPPQDDTVEGPYKAWWKAVEDVVKISKDDYHLTIAGDNRQLLADFGSFLIHDMAARGVAVM